MTANTQIRTILYTQHLDANQLHIIEELRRKFTVHYYPLHGPDEAKSAELPTAEELAEVDVLITFRIPPNLTDIKQTPKLRLVQALSAGYDHILQTSFYESIPKSSDIIFASASGIHVATISEHVLGTTIMLFHRLHQIVIQEAEERAWRDPAKTPGGMFNIRELRGMTVGIIGYGHIGRETARLFHAFGSKIVALTRSGKAARETGYIIPNTGDKDGVLPIAYYSTESTTSAREFFGVCDVVVSTLPSSVATKKFVGREELKAMKGNAVLVNIGRGDTVDTEVLVEALKAERGEKESMTATETLRIGGASLDVTDPEPLPNKHPLFYLTNTIITPHCSGHSSTYFDRALDLAQQNIERLESGKGALNAFRGKGETD